MKNAKPLKTEDEGEGLVEVKSGVLGVPGLLAAPHTDGAELFAAFSRSSELIATTPMRGAIAFKWKKFAQRKWLLYDVVGFAIFLFSCAPRTFTSHPVTFHPRHALSPRTCIPAPLQLVLTSTLTDPPLASELLSPTTCCSHSFSRYSPPS